MVKKAKICMCACGPNVFCVWQCFRSRVDSTDLQRATTGLYYGYALGRYTVQYIISLLSERGSTDDTTHSDFMTTTPVPQGPCVPTAQGIVPYHFTSIEFNTHPTVPMALCACFLQQLLYSTNFRWGAATGPVQHKTLR